MARTGSLGGIAWSVSGAFRGTLYAVPAAVVTGDDVTAGLAVAVGVLPALAVGLAATRRGRLPVALLGVLAGVPIVVGSLVANVPWLAVATVAVLAVAAVLLARRSPFGQVVLGLGLPMVGVGLSYTDVAEAAGLAGLMIAGSIYACLVSLMWPERRNAEVVARRAPAPSIEYGVRLGLAGATAAGIGFAGAFDHVGWATAAALLVMRPVAELQRLRSVGRIVAVTVGALMAGALARLTDDPAWYSLAILLVVGAAGATQGSRWYVLPAFTTFLALSLLVYSDPATAGERFQERFWETVLGVAVAYAFGLALPRLLTARRTPTPPP